MKRIAFLLATFLILTGISPVFAEDLVPDVKSALLMEPSTGTVIYEQNADEKLQIASVTKIMTMLKNVKIYEDKVTNEKHMPEATKPEGLSPEVIREIEEKILGITYED